MHTWLEHAKLLPLGRKKRVSHDCAEERDMIVSHSEEGYSAFCFRCGPVGFEGHGYRNLEELARIKELNNIALEETTHELPKDFTHTIPKDGALWLAKAGIGVARAKALRFGWSPRLARVILPIYSETGSLDYWQGRAVLKGQKPKYINPDVPKEQVLYTASPDAGGDTCVVCEDILSASRVGATIPSASVLGTKVSDAQASRLATFERVIFWLDPDAAGRKGAADGARKLGLVTKTGIIETSKDPKYYSDREIREILQLPALAQPRYKVR